MSAKTSALVTPAVVLSEVGLIRNGSRWITPICLLLADLATLLLIYSLLIVSHLGVSPRDSIDPYLDLLPMLLMTVSGFWIQGLYPGALLHPVELTRKVTVTTTVVFLAMMASSFLWRIGQGYSRFIFISVWLTSPPLILLVRAALQSFFTKYPWWGVPALVLGSGLSARRLFRTLDNTFRGIRVVGVLSDCDLADWPKTYPPLIGPIFLAPEIARKGLAQYVIVTVSQKLDFDFSHVVRDFCYGFSHVLLVPDMPGLCTVGASARDLCGNIGLELPQRLFHASASITKRCLDIVVGTAILLLCLPILMLIGLSITVTSPGPIFFKHERYGKNGRTFDALKFRTMVLNADSALAAYLRDHPDEHLEWSRNHKLKNDPRTTYIGRWLRRLSLDEIPQLLNVLGGDMSLVGPRPIVKDEIEKYGRDFDLYKRVLPGITGLWQVSGRNNTTYDERVAFDQFYVNNWSVWLDMYILARTFGVVLKREGAY